MTPAQFQKVMLSFPHTELGVSYGQPAYKAFGKFLTRLRSEDSSVVLGQVPFDEREMLCAADPQIFHFTDHYRNYPMVLARLDRVDAKTLRSYLMRQWRHNAPKKWLKAWDEGTEPQALPIKTPRPPRLRTGSRKKKR